MRIQKNINMTKISKMVRLHVEFHAVIPLPWLLSTIWTLESDHWLRGFIPVPSNSITSKVDIFSYSNLKN